MKIPHILLVMLVVFGVALPFAVSAQQTQHGNRNHHTNAFRQGLSRVGLSATQHQQIRSIFQQFRASHPKGSRPGKAAVKQLRASILGVLTPQQKQKLHAYVRAHRQKHQRGQRNGASNGQPSPFPNESPLPNPFASTQP